MVLHLTKYQHCGQRSQYGTFQGYSSSSQIRILFLMHTRMFNEESGLHSIKCLHSFGVFDDPLRRLR